MKNFIILLILVAMAYFGYQAFQNSSVINSDGEYEQRLREENLEDSQDIPLTSSEALRSVNTELNLETNTFFTPFLEKIKTWRIQINTYIDANL